LIFSLAHRDTTYSLMIRSTSVVSPRIAPRKLGTPPLKRPFVKSAFGFYRQISFKQLLKLLPDIITGRLVTLTLTVLPRLKILAEVFPLLVPDLFRDHRFAALFGSVGIMEAAVQAVMQIGSAALAFVPEHDLSVRGFGLAEMAVHRQPPFNRDGQ
jgi:hypothetical protein